MREWCGKGATISLQNIAIENISLTHIVICNILLQSKTNVEIRWEHGGESVQVTGSFNNWTDKLLLEKK